MWQMASAGHGVVSPTKAQCSVGRQKLWPNVVMEKAFAHFYVSLQRVVVDERRSTR